MTLKTVGNLVTWSLAGSHRQHDVDAAAEACGLTDVLQLPRIMAVNAYRRAVRAVAQKNGGRLDDRNVVLKVVEDNPDRIVHQFLLGEVGDTGASALSARGAEFTHLCAVRFDKAAYAARKDPATLVEIENVPPGLGRDLAEAVALEYRRTAVDIHYTHADIRTAIVRAVRGLAGIPVLDHGGLFFVPAAFQVQVAALQAFVGHLPGCRLVALPQYDADEILAELRRRSADALDGQLADLLGELERFAQSSVVKVSTVEARVEQFDALRDRVELYERLLGGTMDEMKTKLDAAQEGLLAALSQIKEVNA